jgi:hypothetical protein
MSRLESDATYAFKHKVEGASIYLRTWAVRQVFVLVRHHTR